MACFKFELSMPNKNSWNGRWSGENNLYARVFSTRSKINLEQYKSLLGSHLYNFGDGWCACVEVSEISAQEARTVRRKTQGFCGYDWMIDSLLKNGEILCRN